MLVESFDSILEFVGIPRLPRADPPRDPKINSSYISVGDPTARHKHSAVPDPDGHLALYPDPVNICTRQTMSRGEDATGTYI